jgi:uncharacterized UPF0160 family protein
MHGANAPAQAIVRAVPRSSLSLIEFPAEHPARARRFWTGLLGVELKQVQALGGCVVHPGEHWAVCKDSEGTPFGLAQEPFERGASPYSVG